MARAFGDDFPDKVFKLDIRPDQSSYTLQRTTSGYLQVQLDGGEGRYRRDILGSSAKVPVTFTLDADDYEYISSFYRVYMDSLRPFFVDLIAEDEEIVECLCHIVPDTFKLTKQVARIFTIQATLEVQLPDYDLEADYGSLYMRDALGKDWKKWVERLHVIVNYEYPESLPYPPEEF